MEQELSIKLQEDQIGFQTQVEIPVTTADFYFPIGPRPLLVFVDGPVHLGRAQMINDDETRTLLRKKEYQVLELPYSHYSDKQRNTLRQEIRNQIRGDWSVGPSPLRCNMIK